MTTNNSAEALADRLEEAALAILPFGSGELAQALAEANAVRRGEVPEGRRQDLMYTLSAWVSMPVSAGSPEEAAEKVKTVFPDGTSLFGLQAQAKTTSADPYDQLAEQRGGGQARASRDARIVRAAEGLLAIWRTGTGQDLFAAWDRLVEAVESGARQEGDESNG